MASEDKVEKNLKWFLKIIKSISVRNLSFDSVNNVKLNDLPSPYFIISSMNEEKEYKQLVYRSESVNECCNATWMLNYDNNSDLKDANRVENIMIQFNDSMTNKVISDQIVVIPRLVFISAFNLAKINTLPLNTLLFSNEDGVYVTDSTYQSLSLVTAIKSVNPDHNSYIESLQLLDKQTLQSESMQVLEKELVDINKSIAFDRQSTCNQVYNNQIISQLTRDIEIEEQFLSDEIQQDQLYIADLLTISDLSIDLSSCVDLTKDISDLNVYLMGKYEVLQKNQFLLEAKQLKLLNELQSIYPITCSTVNTTELYSIRGIELPYDLINQRDDEQLSSGLGYIVHLLLLASKYLEIPLRYQLFYYASRSMIRDPITGIGQALPLYRKNNDRERFERAVIWLKKDIEQLLSSRGLNYDSKKDMLFNINQLFACQLCQGMAF